VIADEVIRAQSRSPARQLPAMKISDSLKAPSATKGNFRCVRALPRKLPADHAHLISVSFEFYPPKVSRQLSQLVDMH
jgi:hypothetical protein